MADPLPGDYFIIGDSYSLQSLLGFNLDWGGGLGGGSQGLLVIDVGGTGRLVGADGTPIGGLLTHFGDAGAALYDDATSSWLVSRNSGAVIHYNALTDTVVAGFTSNLDIHAIFRAEPIPFILGDPAGAEPGSLMTWTSAPTFSNPFATAPSRTEQAFPAEASNGNDWRNGILWRGGYLIAAQSGNFPEGLVWISLDLARQVFMPVRGAPPGLSGVAKGPDGELWALTNTTLSKVYFVSIHSAGILTYSAAGASLTVASATVPMRLVRDEQFRYADGEPPSPWSRSHDAPTHPLLVVSNGLQNGAGTVAGVDGAFISGICNSQWNDFAINSDWTQDFQCLFPLLTRNSGAESCTFYLVFGVDTAGDGSFAFSDQGDGTLNIETILPGAAPRDDLVPWTTDTEHDVLIDKKGLTVSISVDGVLLLTLPCGVWPLDLYGSHRIEIETVGLAGTLARLTRLRLYIPNDIPAGALAYNADGASLSVSSGTASAQSINGIMRQQ